MRGTGFTTLLKIKSSDGTITESDSSLSLTGGTEAVLYLSIATSFNGFDKDPAREGLDNRKLAEAQLTNASAKSAGLKLSGILPSVFPVK